MIKSTDIHKFTVTGRGEFPVDMLRYDRCWPRTESHDSVAISSSFNTRNTRILSQALKISLSGIQKPTVGRWESFGWKVTDDS